MILPVYIYGQPVLRKQAEDITPDYPNLKQLIDNTQKILRRQIATVLYFLKDMRRLCFILF